VSNQVTPPRDPISDTETGAATRPMRAWMQDAAGVLAASGPNFIVIAVAYSPTITVNLSVYSIYTTVIIDTTLTGNTIFNLTNGTDGQMIKWRVRQDVVGNRTWTGGANIRFSSTLTAAFCALSTAASKLDYVGFEWISANGKADVLAVNQGF
jgi:hypothetical protein